MPSLKPDAIFFDYGNTLAADSDDRFGDIRSYAESAGLPELTRESFDRGWTAAEQFAAGYREAQGARRWKSDRFWYRFCRAFLEAAYGPDTGQLAEQMHRTQFFTNTLYPDTASTLQELRTRGYRLGVISNWDAPTLKDNFRRFGIDGFFDHILPSWEAEANKPHPEIFMTALRALDVTPERAVHVGDSFHCDVMGAFDMGITPVWVNPEGLPRPEPVPVREVKNLSDLLIIIA